MWIWLPACLFTFWIGHTQEPPASRHRLPAPAPDAVADVSREPFARQQPVWQSGEVIAWLGQANGVREQQAGDLETQLTVRLADLNPRFRWFPWEGDTVFEQWRDLNFGSWMDQMRPLGVSAVVLQFGLMEALEGPDRVAAFEAAYGELLTTLRSVTRRFILISPTPYEDPGHAAAPQLAAQNEVLARYTEAVRRLAAAHDAVFVDVFTPLLALSQQGVRLTENGLHLSDSGRRALHRILIPALTSASVETAPRAPSDATEFAEAARTTALQALVREKNRLWYDLWRPMNWAFIYGDRTEQLFAQPGASGLYLKQELELFQPLLAGLEDRIHRVARGESDPGPESGAAGDRFAPTSAEDVPLEDPLRTEHSFSPHPRLVVDRVGTERDGVINPIHMAWDSAGRLWVACSPTYPHIHPGQAPGDFILVGRDSTGDGDLDVWERFADGLLMVQGVEPAHGGVYVCEGTELTHWKDTTGDGRGDQRRVILAGFGTGDTHQLLNSITHGPDGSLWMTQGHHVYSRVETPWGVARLDKAGVWRYWPHRQRLEGYFPLSTAGANCWGVVFDDTGEVFHKTGDRPEGYYTVPGMISGSLPLEYHGVGSLFSQSRKTTAIEFLGHPHWEDWQGSVALAGFMAHDIVLHRLNPDGSGFSSEPVATLLTSTAEAFRPVGVREGPDGALYIADFHNPIIGHYQHSYRDPRRDQRHGRIWRLRPRTAGSDGSLQPGLTNKSVEALLETLEAPQRWHRDQARRLLFEAPTAKVQAALESWVTAAPSAAERESRLREGVQILAAHERFTPEWADALLQSADPSSRAFAARKLGEMTGPHALLTPASEKEKTPARLTALVQDPHPRVRLNAVIAAGMLETAEAVALATAVLDLPTDRFLTYTLRQLIRARVPQLGTLDRVRTLDWGDNPARLEFVLESAALPEVEPQGQVLYRQFCGNCHQPGGRGLPGVYPPLVNTDWVLGDPEVLIKMVLHGVQGPMSVGGRTYNLPMPPSGFTDTQVADVLTFIRTEWGNAGEAVTADAVRAVRRQHVERSQPWTVRELRPPRPEDGP